MTKTAHEEASEQEHRDDDLDDLLQETRVLLNGVQVLLGFLIILPFSTGFAQIQSLERWVYLAVFVFALISLVFLSAPAAHHRLSRPIVNKTTFKSFATRMIIFGLAAFTVSLGLTCYLVVREVLGSVVGLVTALAASVLIVFVWWGIPLLRRSSEKIELGSDEG